MENANLQIISLLTVLNASTLLPLVILKGTLLLQTNLVFKLCPL